MKKNKKTFKPKRFCGAVLVVMYILVILLPFYSMLLISIVPESQYLQDNVLLYPKSITWEAYQFVFGGASIWQGMLVTSLVTVFGTIYDLFFNYYRSIYFGSKLSWQKNLCFTAFHCNVF